MFLFIYSQKRKLELRLNVFLFYPCLLFYILTFPVLWFSPSSISHAAIFTSLCISFQVLHTSYYRLSHSINTPIRKTPCFCSLCGTDCPAQLADCCSLILLDKAVNSTAVAGFSGIFAQLTTEIEHLLCHKQMFASRRVCLGWREGGVCHNQLLLQLWGSYFGIEKEKSVEVSSSTVC